MNCQFWFNSTYWTDVELDCYGGQYALAWDELDLIVIDCMEVLSGPQQLVHYVYSDDEVPF
ncbi:MAG TPA: hypothetical protein DCX77_07745 [Acidimicrobiaceae bacterium]|nr:hypothetical protein [Acidimicrobiaceae bacterium]